MNQMLPADVFQSDPTRQFFDSIAIGYFVANVFFLVTIVTLVVACCWETTRERRKNALALENRRREAIALTAQAPPIVLGKASGLKLEARWPKSDTGFSPNRN